jgi:hypothetical protein
VFGANQFGSRFDSVLNLKMDQGPHVTLLSSFPRHARCSISYHALPALLPRCSRLPPSHCRVIDASRTRAQVSARPQDRFVATRRTAALCAFATRCHCRAAVALHACVLACCEGRQDEAALSPHHTTPPRL